MANRLPYRTIKRIGDIAGAAVMLGVSAPAFAVIAALIKLESPGPAFYVHQRVGKGGRKIRIFKFRSMQVGADDLESTLNDKDLEEYYKEFKLRKDPRVTEIGHSLRRSSLDELPQLLNVLSGEMSLVGPRPVMEEELKYYSEEELALFLSVKPGLTGYWQVYARNDATYESGKRQEMELWYAEHASLLLDAKLLVMTPLAVLRKRGAY